MTHQFAIHDGLVRKQLRHTGMVFRVINKTEGSRPSTMAYWAGYTLPETLVAMALVALMITALYSGLTMTTVSVKVSQEDLRATQIMLEKMEVIRSYTWAQLFPNVDPDESDDDEGETFDEDDPDSPIDEIPFTIPTSFTARFDPTSTNQGGLEYKGTITIVPADVSEAYSNSLAQVTIEVEWPSNSGTRKRQMRSFFAEHGMQNNITR
jgi:prepilin-type N-terminal cleavage/methylation domain-containing protein